MGTPTFMAPEIVRGEAYPSRNTDKYSLAVLLFYMMMLHHPLDGQREYKIKCMDIYAINKIYGTNPIFMTSMVRPGGALATRPLNFFWIVDCSGSMQGVKIGTVNNSVRDTLPDMRKSARENPKAQLLIRTMKFSDYAE